MSHPGGFFYHNNNNNNNNNNNIIIIIFKNNNAVFGLFCSQICVLKKTTKKTHKKQLQIKKKIGHNKHFYFNKCQTAMRKKMAVPHLILLRDTYKVY